MSLNPVQTLWGRCSSHFADEEIKVQGGRAQVLSSRERGFEAGSAQSLFFPLSPPGGQPGRRWWDLLLASLSRKAPRRGEGKETNCLISLKQKIFRSLQIYRDGEINPWVHLAVFKSRNRFSRGGLGAEDGFQSKEVGLPHDFPQDSGGLVLVPTEGSGLPPQLLSSGDSGWARRPWLSDF